MENKEIMLEISEISSARKEYESYLRKLASEVAQTTQILESIRMKEQVLIAKLNKEGGPECSK